MRRGFELDPKSGNNYAFLLLGLGRPEQAVGIMDRVLSYDPANPFLITDAGAVYQSARRYDEAIVLYRKAQELSPGMAYARIFEPYAVLLAGRPDEAFDRWMWSADAKGPLGMGEEFRTLYKTGGWPAVWKRYIEKFPEKAPRRFDIYALIMLGRRQEAIRELEALEQVGDSWLIRLTDPIFDSLRQEVRFQALMKRIGYPASVIGR
jgi:tetratricopeptide (TPR) repeat protein